MRNAWWVLSPLLLSPLLTGCGLPPAVIVASYAADSVSYMKTGKTVTDHGLSAVTGEDCGLFRAAVTDKPICAKPPEPAKDAPAAPPAAAIAAPPALKDGGGGKDRYITIGSFADHGNAVRAQARYADLSAAIIVVDIGGRRYHRVVVGPLSAGDAATLKARLAADADRTRRQI
jgi:hypothetical protein